MHKVRGSQWRDILQKLMFQYAILQYHIENHTTVCCYCI